MANFIEASFDDNTTIYLETNTDITKQRENGFFQPAASNGRIIKKTKDFLDHTFQQVKSFSNGIANCMKNIEIVPDEFEV